MDVVRAGAAGSAALELAISHALLNRVAARELPSTLRVYRPSPAVAFGKLDALRPGFPAAVEAARAHGYEPVLRLPGGHAAAYNTQSLGLDIVWALDDPVPGTHARFAAEGERLAGALRGLGVDARVGEVPGEYCPGAYSVNARGTVKLIGTAQRLIRGAALLGASVVVGDGPGVRAVLRRRLRRPRDRLARHHRRRRRRGDPGHTRSRRGGHPRRLRPAAARRPGPGHPRACPRPRPPTPT